jgi:hypothetical protein
MSVQVAIEKECNWFILYVDGKEVDGYYSLSDAMDAAKEFSENVEVQL